MAASAEKQRFITALCDEHRVEAAFLYTQCQEQLSGTWPNARKFEQRLRAHLDALANEGRPAIDACWERTDSTDPGELYTAVSIFCRNHQPRLVNTVLDNLDMDEEDMVLAVCHALAHELPGGRKQILEILAAPSTPVRITAEVGAGTRLKEAWPLTRPHEVYGPRTLAPMLGLAGRIHEKSALPLLTQSLGHENENVRSQAATAMLRMGIRDPVIQHCRANKSELPALGLAGDPSDLAFLIQLAETSFPSRDLLISLGLSGHISAIPVLINALEEEQSAEAAARALDLITGAGREEKIFIPDKIDKNELFQEELEKLHRGESPFPPGKAPGVTITRISQSPDFWRQWFRENKQNFIAETRYRNGKPYSPQCLLENMQSETLPQFLRQLAYEEMVIRYGKDFAFETHWPTSFQRQALAKYQQWLKTTEKSFENGRWYFAGRLIE